MEKPVIKVAVRNLVEFILRAGDINFGGVITGQPMQEGTKVHRKLQKEAGEDYKAEVRLSYTKEYDEFILAVDGIADGIIASADGVMIDEIKTVAAPLEHVDENYSIMHWAQAKCYAYMYAFSNSLEHVSIRLTYYNIETDSRKYIVNNYMFSELEAFLFDLLDRYSLWAEYLVRHTQNRNSSAGELLFPYESYRAGQRELAAYVYCSIRDKRNLFAQAPTGTGKTISVLFPAIKAMGQGMGGKVFYLTAKTVTRQVAEDALLLMQEKGLAIKAITITSRERICPCEKRKCNPDDCPYARGHYDRINNAIMDIITNESVISRDILESYSKKHMVCPFEYTLDIAMWIDCVICDYNYVYDPRAYLRRFFEYGGDYTILADESHNLVDRAREMFSIELSKRAFMEVKKDLKQNGSSANKVLNKINKFFIDLRKSFDKAYDAKVMELPVELYPLIEKFVEECEVMLARGGSVPENTINLFFDCISFIAVFRLYDERYVTYATREDDEVRIKLFCVDPSYLLAKTGKKVRSSIYFSATLLPLKYYKDMLGGSNEDCSIQLSSPFQRSNLCLMVGGSISTRYRDRQGSYERISNYIKIAVGQKKGNYFVFFPSFEYMRNVYKIYIENWPDDQTIIQNGSMSDDERVLFLSRFKTQPDCALIAFAVMGGIFSEGIDLAGDRLSGAIIIGVGLPQICMERDVICNYFNESNGMGYEYAYMYPGMNRVLQAAGRVIRTETDRGFVLLLDDRFLHKRYLGIFPREWQGYRVVPDVNAIMKIMGEFWNR